MKGHAILGTISGFLFGLFLGVTLFLFGVLPLSSQWLWILPLLGILLGLIMAAWAPFGRSAAPQPAPVAAPPPPVVPPADPTPITSQPPDADPDASGEDQPGDG
jgi:predicted lipid-binding transport protein (Tim44 family)